MSLAEGLRRRSRVLMSETEGGAEGADMEVPGAAPGGKSKLVPLLLIINTALMGAVLFLVLKKPAAAPPAPKGAEAAAGHGAEGQAKEGEGHGEGDKHAAPAPSAKPGPVLKLDPFIIQLRSAETERYVRLAFELEMLTEADKQAYMERTPHVRDAVIAYFSDRTLDELRGSEGIERTKEALIRRFEEIVPGRRVRTIFVTDFVMQ
jgi:flagellar protein FliL